MNSRFLYLGILIAFAVPVGCTQSGAKNTSNHTASVTPDASRRMITGSHIPQPVNRVPFGNVSANIPVGSASRKPDSLVPSEPTVGAGGQSDYRLREPSTGAGPEGSAPQPTPN